MHSTGLKVEKGIAASGWPGHVPFGKSALAPAIGMEGTKLELGWHCVSSYEIISLWRTGDSFSRRKYLYVINSGKGLVSISVENS